MFSPTTHHQDDIPYSDNVSLQVNCKHFQFADIYFFFLCKLMLRTKVSVLPKVVTSFHIGQSTPPCHLLCSISSIQRRRDASSPRPKENSERPYRSHQGTLHGRSALCEGSLERRREKLCRSRPSLDGLSCASKSATDWPRNSLQKAYGLILPEQRLLPLN